jgi:hypothetical protein
MAVVVATAEPQRQSHMGAGCEHDFCDLFLAKAQNYP